MSTIRAQSGPAIKTGELVAQTLRVRIARGELAPGDRLPPEDELMANLGLARTTVREGLRILESQGLIEVRRGRQGGGRVTHPSVEHLAQGFALTLQLQQVTYEDLDQANQLIEPALAARLARSHTEEDLAALRASADRAAEASRTNNQPAFSVAATDFHETVVIRAGNKTLATMSLMLHELRREYYFWASQQTVDQKNFERAVRSYRKLIRLVEQGDADGAEDHWRKQLRYISSKPGRAYNSPIAFI
jgi:GntR family transcriptional repressor for pyruvate dehydrogenase complex